jgi:hypothetical protein
VSALSFKTLLQDHGLDPRDVTLIRHQKKVAGRPTSFGLWANDREKFEVFQEIQSPTNRAIFGRPLWASFVVPPDGSTLFVGIYRATLAGEVSQGFIDPLTGIEPGADKAGPIKVYDRYQSSLTNHLHAFIGRLKIDWGNAFIQWKQKADRQDKAIVGLIQKEFDVPFPGYRHIVVPLTQIANAPASWRVALSSVSGIYLLTCPKTKEQYVGKASGTEGFWGRWQEYIANGHGGNIALKSRERSDYQVSILEVCGSSTTQSEIDALEALWKKKLQSREMGLNKN